MRTFKFENDLVDEVIARWVLEHHRDPECRKVLDAHEKAARLGTVGLVAEYEQALREINIIKPWNRDGSFRLFKKPCIVKGGIVV